MISSMKRTYCWTATLFLVVAASHAATIPSYVNATPLYSPPTPAPVIDARAWVNRAVFSVTSPTLVPFQAYNNRLFTNSAATSTPM